MATHLKQFETILIPFKNGFTITDSQGKPRMYKTRKSFEKTFPKHLYGTDGVELVEFAEVRHGRWIPKKVDAIATKFQCSECGRTVECGNDYFGKPTKYVSSTFPYCHCGAKMDAEVSK